MAKKISDLTLTTSVAADDISEVVDISDTTEAATGTNKRITADNKSLSYFGFRDTDDLAEGATNKYFTGTLTADLNVNNNDLTNIKAADFDVNAIGNSGATKTINLEDGRTQTITIDQNTTLTIASTFNTTSNVTFTDANLYTVAFVGVTWLTTGGAAPTFDGTDVVTFYKDGTTIFGLISNQS